MTTANALHGGPRIDGLYATTPAVLPFATTPAVRSFLLGREAGNLLIYSTARLAEDESELRVRGGVTRQYLNHWHEAMFGFAPPSLSARLVYHEAEAAGVREHGGSGDTFLERHLVGDDFEVIPTPGHTAGATAYLWTGASSVSARARSAVIPPGCGAPPRRGNGRAA